MKTRVCRLAGDWYPSEPSHLEQMLEKLFQEKEPGVEAMGIVAPHAGYWYSGTVSAMAYSAIPDSFSGTFVVIGPSHRGYRTSISLLPWETPLGIVDNDSQLGSDFGLEVDEVSFQDMENSLEVQVPFIKFRFPRAKIVPVLMGDQDFQSARSLADVVLDAIRRSKRKDIRIVASSDFSHVQGYQIPLETMKENDLRAIAALEDLDVEEFYRSLIQYRVSACGYGPISVMCLTCRELGARRAALLKYMTSAEVSGRGDYVVGYAAIAVM